MGETTELPVVTERPLTIYLNSQEIVTVMTIGDYPALLAIGYLKNQGMLNSDDQITATDVDEDLNVVVVRTKRETNYEEKLSRKVRTSGCAVGTVYGDIMDGHPLCRHILFQQRIHLFLLFGIIFPHSLSHV